jgi:hypothetical protein
VASIAALKDLVLAGAKHFGWEVNQTPSVSVQGEKVAVVFDEELRAKLIAQWEQLLAKQSNEQARKVSAPVVTLPAQETQSSANIGTGDPAPIANGEEKNAAPSGDDKPDMPPSQPDAVSQRMESIGRAESWAGIPEPEPKREPEQPERDDLPSVGL